MPVNQKLGTAIDRRTMLRTGVGAGLTLPFGLPALARAQETHEGHEVGTPEGGYVGSDPKSPSTGDEAPTPADVEPFERYDPFLQPIEPGSKDVDIIAQDRTVFISNDVAYAAWTFNGTVPGPILHAIEGDEVNFHFEIEESASAAHSVDLHSAQGNPENNYKTILPGESFDWSFVPEYPGAYMYHCGTAPVLMHIGAGMYGAMIVRPKDGWPTEVTQEIVLVQSDFYTKPSDDADSAVTVPDYQRMYNGFPVDVTAFNGHASQYVDEPIKVKAGEPLRIYVVNAGPNVFCTFHVVGGIFSAAYFNANPENKIVGQQSMTIGPGDGAAFEITLKEPGLYPAVNHAFGHAAHGAIALLEAV